MSHSLLLAVSSSNQPAGKDWTLGIFFSPYPELLMCLHIRAFPSGPPTLSNLPFLRMPGCPRVGVLTSHHGNTGQMFAVGEHPWVSTLVRHAKPDLRSTLWDSGGLPGFPAEPGLALFFKTSLSEHTTLPWRRLQCASATQTNHTQFKTIYKTLRNTYEAKIKQLK